MSIHTKWTTTLSITLPTSQIKCENKLLQMIWKNINPLVRNTFWYLHTCLWSVNHWKVNWRYVHVRLYTLGKLILLPYVLTLILSKPKMISSSLCHQYRTRPACMSMHSDQALTLLTDQFQVFTLKWKWTVPKSGRWIITF